MILSPKHLYLPLKCTDLLKLDVHHHVSLIFFVGLYNDSEIQLAFHVKRSTSLSGSLPLNIQFNVITTNFGGFWNVDMSSFMSPIKGLYVFHLNILQNGGWGRAEIMHNGKTVQTTEGWGGYNATPSASVVIEMAAFDQVYVRLVEGQTYERGHSYAHFTGYLLTSLA